MRLTVKVIPRASKNEVVGTMANGILKVRLMAAPVDGAANDALITLLARHLAVTKSAISIVRGKTARLKTIDIS